MRIGMRTKLEEGGDWELVKKPISRVARTGRIQTMRQRWRERERVWRTMMRGMRT